MEESWFGLMCLTSSTGELRHSSPCVTKPRTILGIWSKFLSLAELLNNSDFISSLPPSNINFNLASARS